MQDNLCFIENTNTLKKYWFYQGGFPCVFAPSVQPTDSSFIADEDWFAFAFIRPAEGKISSRRFESFAEEDAVWLWRFSRRSRHGQQSWVSIGDRELSSLFISWLCSNSDSYRNPLRLCGLRAKQKKRNPAPQDSVSKIISNTDSTNYPMLRVLLFSNPLPSVQFNILSEDNCKSEQRSDHNKINQPVDVLFQEIHCFSFLRLNSHFSYLKRFFKRRSALFLIKLSFYHTGFFASRSLDI